MTFKNLATVVVVLVGALSLGATDRYLRGVGIKPTGGGTLTFPTSTDTFVGKATTDVFTNKSLSDSTSYVVDQGDNTKKLALEASGITTATTRTWTVPDRNLTVNLGTDISSGSATKGQILASDGAGASTWRDHDDPIRLASMYWEFIGDSLAVVKTNSGTGSISNIRAAAGSAAHPGVHRLSTGTTTTGYGNVFGTDQDDYVIIGGGETTFEALVKLSAVSTGAQTHAVVCGLSRGPYLNTLPGLDGIYFYGDANANANWRIRTQAASATTDGDTGSAMTTSWTRLTWVLNAAGTSVQAYIDGVSAGSAVTTNIPTLSLNPQCMILKSAGTTAVTFDIDYIKLKIVLTTAR